MHLKMPGVIMLSWLVLLLPLTLLRRNMRRLLSLRTRTRTKTRARQRGMRLRPAKRTPLLGNHRSQRKKVKNKRCEGAVFFTYTYHYANRPDWADCTRNCIPLTT